MPRTDVFDRPLLMRLHWILRLGIAGEFIGHGWVGTGRPAAWLPFFHVFGFSSDFGDALMPVIGAWDISVGLLMLALPLRLLLVWTAVWGLLTAFLRPLAGQGWWEFFERAGNYGVPLALLLLAGAQAGRQSVWTWLRPAGMQATFSRGQAQRLVWVLRLTVAGLLIGHGGIGAFMHRQAWTAYFTVLGITASTVADRSLIEAVGWFEMLLGGVLLLRPFRGLLLLVFCWKVFTEFLRLLAGEEIGQFIERSGSYAAPLALALVVTSLMRSTSEEPNAPFVTGAAARSVALERSPVPRLLGETPRVPRHKRSIVAGGRSEHALGTPGMMPVTNPETRAMGE